MVYLRKKKVKGVDYLYLVKSVWDKKRKTSKQITIKYLGESKSVTRDDIPIEFRDDPKINSFLLENTPKDRKRREEILKKLQVQLFSSLTEGNLKESIRIYELFVNKSSIEEFYEKILNPIMQEVGSMWADGRLSIATEHVSSNTAQSLIKIISENHKRSTLDKGKVIITTPVGEEHCLSCNMIESFLLSKGFTTFNLSPSTPSNSLVEFVRSINPTAVLISITLTDNIKAGQRLATKIHNQHRKLPVYVGGQALNGTKSKFDATRIEPSTTLEQIPKILIKKTK
jgi:methanogenic corrinoid protein MtbC1